MVHSIPGFLVSLAPAGTVRVSHVSLEACITELRITVPLHRCKRFRVSLVNGKTDRPFASSIHPAFHGCRRNGTRFRCIAEPLFRYITNHCFTVSLYRCIAVPLFHCVAVSNVVCEACSLTITPSPVHIRPGIRGPRIQNYSGCVS